MSTKQQPQPVDPFSGISDFEDLDHAVSTTNNLLEKAVFEEKRRYRVGFPLLNPETKAVRLRKVWYFAYNEVLKKSFLLPKNEVLTNRCKPKMGDPKFKYVTPLVIYGTDSTGKLLSPFQFRVLPFVLVGQNLQDVQMLASEYSLMEHDVLLECTNKVFQNVKVMPAKGAYWTRPEVKNQIEEAVQKLVPEMHKAVSIEVSDATICRWLGIDLPNGAAPEESGIEEISFGAGSAEQQQGADSDEEVLNFLKGKKK